MKLLNYCIIVIGMSPFFVANGQVSKYKSSASEILVRVENLQARIIKDPNYLDKINPIEKLIFEKSRNDKTFLEKLDRAIFDIDKECKSYEGCDDFRTSLKEYSRFKQECDYFGGNIVRGEEPLRQKTLYRNAPAIALGASAIALATIFSGGAAPAVVAGSGSVAGALGTAGGMTIYISCIEPLLFTPEMKELVDGSKPSSYRCVLPDHQGCPENVRKDRKIFENFFADLGMINFHKYKYSSDLSESLGLPSLYMWCKGNETGKVNSPNHQDNLINDTKSSRDSLLKNSAGQAK